MNSQSSLVSRLNNSLVYLMNIFKNYSFLNMVLVNSQKHNGTRFKTRQVVFETSPGELAVPGQLAKRSKKQTAFSRISRPLRGCCPGFFLSFILITCSCFASYRFNFVRKLTQITRFARLYSLRSVSNQKKCRRGGILQGAKVGMRAR